MLRSFGLTMVVAVCSSAKRESMIWALKKASPKVEGFDLKNSQSYRSMKRASTARANEKASSNILGFNLKSAHWVVVIGGFGLCGGVMLCDMEWFGVSGVGGFVFEEDVRGCVDVWLMFAGGCAIREVGVSWVGGVCQERTAKLHNDILMFQQHHGESLSEAWTRFKDLLQKFPHHGINLWLQVQIFYDHVNPVSRRTIDQSADVKAIALPQDVPSTSDRRLIELENQVQGLMGAHLALTQPTQVNKSLPHVKLVVVPTALSIAWKIPNKPLLNTHPRVPMKREVSGIPLS
ncbi:hypothetical protein Tco_1524579 [Tanacetum coccineum]